MSNLHPEYLPNHPIAQAEPVTVLVIEPGKGAAMRVEKALLSANDKAIRVESATSLAGALECLAKSDIEVVLVDGNLPDSGGTELFSQLRLAAPNALVLPLTGVGGQFPPASGEGELFPDPGTSDMDWLSGAIQYVTRRKTTEAAWRAADEALFEEKERARVTLGSIGDAVLVTDVQGNVTYINQVAEVLTGWTNSAAIGQLLPTVFNISDKASGKRGRNPALHAMTENTTVGLAANCVLSRLDGSEVGIEDSAAPVHDRHGQVTGAVIVFRDVNQSITMTRKMAWLAGHDSLTGLASRTLFEDRFKQVASLASRQEGQAAILFLDLNNFKAINDLFGHHVGDRVLKRVARHLLRGVRDTDTVGRHGGDEFVILLADVADATAAERAARGLIALFADPLLVEGHSVTVSMSIGISMYPGSGEDMHSLVEHADTAMYEPARTPAASSNHR